MTEKDKKDYFQQGQTTEDTLEEVSGDVEFDDECFNDVLIMEIEHCSWPNSKDKLTFSTTYAYPLFADKETIKPCFPMFDKFFDITGIDRINDIVTICVHEGKKDAILDIKLGETVKYDFAYASQSLKRETYRTGRVNFKYLRFWYSSDQIPGKIAINEKYLINDVIDSDNTGCFNSICDEEDKAGCIDLVGGDVAYICLVDAISNFVLLYCFCEDKKSPDGIGTVYYPIYLDKGLEEVSTFLKKGEKHQYIKRFYMIEGLLDKEDKKCFLKIHQHYFWQDSYSHENFEDDIVMEIVDGPHLSLPHSGHHIFLGRINKKTHELAIFIGKSDNKKYCRYYYASLRNPVEYVAGFNGGCNDNFHVEEIKINVEVIKK